MRYETSLKHLFFRGDVGTRRHCSCCVPLAKVKRESNRAARRAANKAVKIACVEIETK